MRNRYLPIFAMLLFAAGASADETGKPFVAAITEVPLYANALSMLRRLEHGLAFRKAVMDAQIRGIDVDQFIVNPADEAWEVTLPQEAGGFGVLVWIPGDDDASVPPGIRPAALDQGLAVITAANIALRLATGYADITRITKDTPAIF